MEITCCNKINTHLKWFALKGNCINCSIVQFLVLQRIAGPFPAASHNLKHLTYFMKSVRVCGCSWREAPAVITGGLTDFIYSLGSFYNCPCCSPFAALKANAKFNVCIQEFDHNYIWEAAAQRCRQVAAKLVYSQSFQLPVSLTRVEKDFCQAFYWKSTNVSSPEKLQPSTPHDGI